MNSINLVFIAAVAFTTLSITPVASAAGKPKKLPAKVAAKPVASAKPAAPAAPVAVPGPQTGPLAGRLPASLSNIDPNSAVEIRGQARSLSMMLVLKNGKDSINFIKPRKDYKAEISTTEY